jgi:hypothetical protein
LNFYAIIRFAQQSDFKWLKALQELTGSRFIRGVVFYMGDKIIPFGERLFAIPVHQLWQK